MNGIFTFITGLLQSIAMLVIANTANYGVLEKLGLLWWYFVTIFHKCTEQK